MEENKKEEEHSLELVSNEAYQVAIGKGKDGSTPQETVETGLVDSTYAVIEERNHNEESLSETATITNKKNRINERVYFSIEERNHNEESLSETATITNKKNRINKRAKISLVLIVVLIMVAIISCVCYVIAFLEISRLKSEIAIASVQIATMKSEIVSLQQVSSVTSNSSASSGEQWCSAERCISTLEISQSIKGVQLLNESYISVEDQLQLLNDTFAGQLQNYPAISCAAVLQLNSSSPSGYYWIRSSNGSAVHVYCDMTLSCGNITGGWVRVANLDMTDNSTQCPGILTERIDSNIRTCAFNSELRGCLSIIMLSNNRFSKVCGKVKAYQFGSTDAFSSSGNSYVDGITLTYGSPRRHIWTFAAARDETGSSSLSNCPCINASSARGPPAFVGNDYFCDTGSANSAISTVFYGDDPLWDGAGCGPLNTCCTFNNPPWFYKELPEPTKDDIEMQVCRDGTDENIAIEMAHIYIQ